MLQLHLCDQQFSWPTKVRLILETWRYIFDFQISQKTFPQTWQHWCWARCSPRNLAENSRIAVRLSEKNFCFPSTTLRSFGSVDHFGIFVLWNAYRSWFACFFFAKKWPVFQRKNLTRNKNLWHLCNYYVNVEKLKKKNHIFFFFFFTFRSPSRARDFQTP